MISVKGKTTLCDVFAEVRRVGMIDDLPDDESTLIDLWGGTIQFFAIRKGSEVEQKWIGGGPRNPADLGDPSEYERDLVSIGFAEIKRYIEYKVSSRVDRTTDQRSRRFVFGDPNDRAINQPGSLSWNARDAILIGYYATERGEEGIDS